MSYEIKFRRVLSYVQYLSTYQTWIKSVFMFGLLAWNHTTTKSNGSQKIDDRKTTLLESTYVPTLLFTAYKYGIRNSIFPYFHKTYSFCEHFISNLTSFTGLMSLYLMSYRSILSFLLNIITRWLAFITALV